MKNGSFWRTRLLGAGLLVLLVTGNFSICMATSGEYYPPVEIDPALQAMFQQAIGDRDAGRISSSIEAFQTILSSQPMLHRARLELAVAYYHDYKFQEAVKQAEKVLEDPNTPANVRVTILAFLAQVKKDSSAAPTARNYWYFPVSLGFTYSDNVNVGPDTAIVDALNLVAGSEAQNDSGSVFTAGIDHTLQTAGKLTMGEDSASFLWQSGLHVYQLNYIDETNYDLDVYTFRTGPSLISRGNWRANLTLQEDYIRYGDEELAYYSYLLPSFSLNLTESMEATLDGILCDRNYTRAQEQDQDSIYGVVRLSIGYTFGKDRFGVQAGTEYFNENASKNRFSNEGTKYFTGVNWRLFGKFNLFALVSRKDVNYDEPPPEFYNGGIKREGLQKVYSGGMNYIFQEMGWLNDWKMEAKVMKTEHNSNYNAYDYNRTQSTITLSHIFR